MILVLEDNKALRMIIRKALEKAGYDVKTAENGEEGLKILEEETPDLIISDVIMPEMDGFEFLKKIRKKHPLVPFTFLTVKSELEDYSKGYELGATDYITKPFDVEILLKKVEKRIASGKILIEIIEEGKNTVDLGKILPVDLITRLKENKIDCKITISSPDGNGSIEIKKGKIKKSAFDDLEDKQALLKIAGLHKGEIEIER
ncbi:MAG: response regulator [candidate division WOR-3 bacterium]